MYRFAGYLVKNQNGDVVQYSPTQSAAVQFAIQHAISVENINKVYEWRVGWDTPALQPDVAPQPQVDLPPTE